MSVQNKVISTLLSPCHRHSSLEEFYALMMGIRLFELSLLEMFGQGLLAGTTHTCLGQEATAVGVVSALERESDIILSNHRCHGHFLAYCGQVEALYAEIMGKPSGVCGGRGGSQHLHFKNFYSNGIQGGIMPIAIGMAKAQQLKKSKAIVTVFVGDGTFGEGAVYEALNLASLWKLPILLVVENNGYAQSTPTYLQLSGSFAGRLQGFDIPVKELKTTDVREILQVSGQVIDHVRQESKPHALIIEARRLGPHSKGDDHRSQEEMEAIRAQEPLNVMKALIKSETQNLIQQQMQELIDACRQKVMEERGYV